MTPITRLEKFLNGIVCGGSVPEPRTRIETMLNDIKNGDVVSLTPLTREEIFLAKISGADVVIPDPITRIETFLAKIAGAEVETPMPITRIEWWLNEWSGGSDPLNTFTGEIVRFLAKRAKPIVKLEANFTPIQDLNGQEAPYPPGGWKNLLDAGYKESITGSKLFTFAKPLPVGTYTFSFEDADTTAIVASYQFGVYKDTTAAYSCYAVSPNSKKVSVTTTETCSKIVLYSNKAYNESQGFTTEFTGLQVELGSTATAWTPYSNICPISGHTGCDIFDKAEYDAQATPTVTINFGQTVYSGTLTVNEDGTGTVTATDTGSPQLLWVRGSANNAGTGRIFYAYYTRAETNVSTITMTNGALKTVTRSSAWEAQEENSISFGATNVLIVTDNVDTTLADLPTWLSNNGLQLVGTLKTPLTFTVTASQINTLVGENNVWVNDATGDITVQAYGTEIT